MANPYQEQARWRKIIYFVAIVVLFTTAMLHRYFIVEPMANNLQLRESARGEVELAGSAVRLLMTGSRGIASTFLWSAAIEKQKKHEWNEVELIVASITKLQPNFIQPWLFQSWNLAFNVSVECDRPKDKYYYVTRGLDLLAEGERRNRGNGFYPGHPEIRQTIGIFYLRKLGLSDEKTTMRCLHDLSCIDPLLRNPKWMMQTDPQRREVVNTREFARFCQENPRLVRRLREGLGYSSDLEIIDFLTKNRDVPSRFEAPNWAALPAQPPEQRQSKLKEAIEQFPILPPAKQGESVIATSPGDYNLSKESLDVFLMARSWIEYSMEPLPPPLPDEEEQREFVKANRKYRLPKQMAQIIFRSYPARCQAYIAEGLEEEGWFDQEGWVITKWFDSDPGFGENEFRVGTEKKYLAQPSWDHAANLYYDYGIRNDLLFTPQVENELSREAELYRKTYGVPPGRMGPRRSDETPEMHKSWLAHHRLIWNTQNRAMTNFDNHYYAALAERTSDCVTARKLLHRGKELRATTAREQAIEAFDQAWPFWINVFLQNPKFANQSMVQEDVYEFVRKSMMMAQREREGTLRSIVAGVAQMGVWPYPPLEKLMTPSEKSRVIPIRNARGLMEWVQVPDLFSNSKLTDQELLQTRMALSTWPMATAGYPGLMQSPPLWNLLLTRTRMREETVPAGWHHLIDEANVQTVRERLKSR